MAPISRGSRRGWWTSPIGSCAALALLTVLGSAAKAEPPPESSAIARVNGVAIPRAEFDVRYAKRVRSFTSRDMPVPEELVQHHRQKIVKTLVDRELWRQAVAEAGVAISRDELDRAFTDYKRMFRTENNFQHYLARSGTSIDRIRADIEIRLAVDKLFGTTSVAEARAYYREHLDRYTVKDRVRASHILFKVPKDADKHAEEAVRQRAERVRAQVIDGADFAELAIEHCEAPTASRGGDLGYFSRGRMVPAFDKVAFALRPGEISELVRTRYGWHIVLVTDRESGHQRPFDEVKSSILKLLDNKRRREGRETLLETLRAAAHIEIYE